MNSPEKRKPNTTYTAPVGSIDLMHAKADGTPNEIWPCHDCLPWHAEVVVVDEEIVVREWHAIDCPHFQDLLKDD
ncbi:hypothetical protein DP939_36380 [Spongiactinospora rosea]|uniref:Uncharacterized protein n=1 Tax=Spongiactinospora rosea TaxID=2248750 RepID=A0A366LN81_9ACTN|nr:hypothetical protein [Spongiactinospora rosea]RBQ15361.1 hypothetical protein DP939_36380 [Spongiactinospora rosea]